MKKTLLKLIVFLAVFLIALVVSAGVMNKGHNNMTMEMADASLPVIAIDKGGVWYNELHGYTTPMDTAFERDTVTVLGEGRDIYLKADTFDRNVTGMSIQVRSIDGERLVEDTQITDFAVQDGLLTTKVALKDLIERDVEYVLIIVLTLDEKDDIYYYTRVIWSDKLHMEEKLEFVLDFHERLYNRERARELTKYLETNAQLEDNSSFHKVNIHSSFRQITWGNLAVEEVGKPGVRLTEIAEQTASFLVDYKVSSGMGKEKIYYKVKEHFRVRYTPDRMYLLAYERTMTQIPDVDRMYANDKILLGITGTDVPMMESEDGNNVVFEVNNQLLCYNVNTNKLAVIFSFQDEDHQDSRTVYDRHSIKILDVDEGGNVSFAVYGYMNRGRHEGEVGIQIYTFNSALNTIEEKVYIPYHKNYAVLRAQMEQLLYLNREQQLYLMLENTIYCIDLAEKTYYPLTEITQDDSIRVSDNHKILLWLEGGDIYHCGQLNVNNLNTGISKAIIVGKDESVRPLGFMGEDIIFGVAKQEDIRMEHSGRIMFPMYKICICNPEGKILKTYQQDEMYVVSCSVEGNQITLERVRRKDDYYADATADHITNNVEEESGKNLIVAADIDIYERYVQIQTRAVINARTIQVLTPKEVVFEGGRELILEPGENRERYYVYGPYGVEAIYSAPSGAVEHAYAISGVVTNENGDIVWLKGSRAARNQIMAIKEDRATEEKNSLSVCLDTILRYEGIIRNSDYLMGQGHTVLDILRENLEDVQILDLTGCKLDAILYYVNQDIPVLALLEDGDAVLITGFNEYNTVIMEPSTGKLYKKGMNDSAEWFAENGNHFITYIRR